MFFNSSVKVLQSYYNKKERNLLKTKLKHAVKIRTGKLKASFFLKPEIPNNNKSAHICY